MSVNSPSTAPDSPEFSLSPQGDYAGRPPIKLVKPVVIAGAEEHCHLHLVSSTVSRHHALVVREKDRVYVCDLGSRTKVQINGQDQRESELSDGDEVRIGKFCFKFNASQSPNGPSPQPDPASIIADGQTLPLEHRLLVIGRTEGADLVFPDATVSSRHAIIFKVGGKRYVRDLDSRTGTFLNGEKIHQHEIKPGDELRVGEATLKLTKPATTVIEEPLPLEPASAESAEPPPLEPEPQSPPQPQATAPAVAAQGPAPLELEPEPSPLASAPPASAGDTSILELESILPKSESLAEIPPDAAAEPIAPAAEPVADESPIPMEPEPTATEPTDDKSILELESLLPKAESEEETSPEASAEPMAPVADDAEEPVIPIEPESSTVSEAAASAPPAAPSLDLSEAPETPAELDAPIAHDDVEEPPLRLKPELATPTEVADAPETPQEPESAEPPATPILDLSDASETPAELDAPIAHDVVEEPPRRLEPESAAPTEFAATPETPEEQVGPEPAAPLMPSAIDRSDATEAPVEPPAQPHPQAAPLPDFDILAELAKDRSEEFKPVELEPEFPSPMDRSAPADTDAKPPESDATLLSAEPGPIAEQPAQAVPAEVSSEPGEKKSRRGRPRRSRGKRTAPETTVEESPVPVESSAPVESASPVIQPPAEPPTVEVPESEVAPVAQQPPDFPASEPEPVPAEATATPEPSSPEPAPPEVEPAGPQADAEPLLSVPELVFDSPVVSVGTFAYLSGGTVNLDHSLGGMPIELRELPPAPTGFGQIKIDLTGNVPLPFSATAPMISPEPEPQADLASPPDEAPPPPSLPESTAEAAPQEPAAVEPPAPTPATPTPPPKPPPPKPPPPRSVPRAAPRKPSDFVAEQAGGWTDIVRQPRDADGFSQIATAFDGLAPAVRETDIFSNFDAAPINDAAFGGPRLSRPDEYILPDSSDTAARQAAEPEHDFADDEFWNRTDEEEDAAAAKSAPPPEPLALAPQPIAPEEPQPIAPEPEPIAAEPDQPQPQAPEPSAEPVSESSELLEQRVSAEEFSSLEEPLPAQTAEPETPQSPPPARRRRRFRIPFLLPVILLATAGAVGAIWRFVPVQSRIIGTVTFENYGWTSGTQDGNDFEAAQRRLIDSDQTRLRAEQILHQDDPGTSPGFLSIPSALQQTTASVSLSCDPDASPVRTLLQLPRTVSSAAAADINADRQRMQSLLKALVDANGPLLQANRSLRDAQRKAQQAVDQAAKKAGQIKSELSRVQMVIDAQPPLDLLTQLAARKAQFERARHDAEQAVNRDRDGIYHLQAEPASYVTGAATQPDVSDPQLNRMRQELADLSAEIDSVKSDQLTGAAMARQQLETAASQFDQQLTAAETVFGESARLRQFINSARDSQARARELIDMLIVDGEDLEKQIEDTRRDVEQTIESRQQQKWAGDPQLQQLHQQLDSAEHRYNANVGQGITDPRILDPLQQEIDGCTARLQARQALLGVDPGDIRVEEGLNMLVQSLRNKLQSEKREIDNVLGPVEKQLNGLDPVVAALPLAQQDQARQIHARLDALNEARRKYAAAVGDGDVNPSAKIANLQKRVADLKQQIAQRQAELARQKQQSFDVQQTQSLAAANSTLEADERKLEASRNANGGFLLVFEEKEAEHDAGVAAQTRKMHLLDDQRAADAQLEAAQRTRDDKQSAAQRAFDIRPITAADVIATAPIDPRMTDSIFAVIAGLAAAALLMLISHFAAEQAFRRRHAHPHAPPAIPEQLDSLILPMADPHPPTAE
jgi:pSer/pThr/pTyr-binding forkhead associated (FHA) protein